MLIWYIRNLQMYLMCGLQKMYNSNILFFWPGRVFHGCVSSQNSCIDIECIICDHINDHVKTKRSKNWQKKKKCGLLCWADLFFLMIISCCVLCVIHFFSFSLLVYKVSMCILALMPTCHVLWLLNRKRLQQCFQWASSSGAAAVHPQMTSDYRGTAAVWAFSSCLTVVSHKFSNTVVATPRVKKKGFCSESQHNIRMVWI